MKKLFACVSGIQSPVQDCTYRAGDTHEAGKSFLQKILNEGLFTVDFLTGPGLSGRFRTGSILT